MHPSSFLLWKSSKGKKNTSIKLHLITTLSNLKLCSFPSSCSSFHSSSFHSKPNTPPPLHSPTSPPPPRPSPPLILLPTDVSHRFHHKTSSLRSIHFKPSHLPHPALLPSFFSRSLHQHASKQIHDEKDSTSSVFSPYVRRHIGPSLADQACMLKEMNYPSMNDFVERCFPSDLVPFHLLHRSWTYDEAPGSRMSEHEVFTHVQALAKDNEPLPLQFMGQGFYGTHLPTVIQRNVLENPGWYTSYSPYQPEISQGRLTALFLFQTLIAELTGFPLANASLLDEGSAAGEVMMMCLRIYQGLGRGGGGPSAASSSSSSSMTNKPANVSAQSSSPTLYLLVDDLLFLHTKACLQMRAEALGIQLLFGDLQTMQFDKQVHNHVIGAIVQYPLANGQIWTHLDWIKRYKEAFPDAPLCCATDLLALTLLQPPSELNMDIAFGTSQRFGIPLGYGGPHAAFLACHFKHVRKLPGRLVGYTRERPRSLVHEDKEKKNESDQRKNTTHPLEKPSPSPSPLASFGEEVGGGYRLALQTREQHIRREKATSNICTSQALLANMSAFYAMYHGPKGLKDIAERIHRYTSTLAKALLDLGYELENTTWFDTLTVRFRSKEEVQRCLSIAQSQKYHLIPGIQVTRSTTLTLSLDETHTLHHVHTLLHVFAEARACQATVPSLAQLQARSQAQPLSMTSSSFIPSHARRTVSFLEQAEFHRYHSETEMLRYLKHLENKDLSLCHAMMPLGSCTMKLNGTTSLMSLSMPGFSQVHPYSPSAYTLGYQRLLKALNQRLCQILGMDQICFQPNSGAQGEYAGLRVIQAYLNSQGQGHRHLCVLPASAHGTNPASAILAGYQVKTLPCDGHGQMNLKNVHAWLQEFGSQVACFMVTYPSTWGALDPGLPQLIQWVHEVGGQVYLDGGNLNALVGCIQPGSLGIDVCHVNLHKTFCIPHGGGGPGAGPIAVRSHLVPFLPRHPYQQRSAPPKEDEPQNEEDKEEEEGKKKLSFSSAADAPLVNETRNGSHVEKKKEEPLATLNSRNENEEEEGKKSSPSLPSLQHGSLDLALGPVTSSPYGSAWLYPIPYTYLRLMGAQGLTQATHVALLNANYLYHCLSKHYKLLPSRRRRSPAGRHEKGEEVVVAVAGGDDRDGEGGCAHEFLIDLSEFHGLQVKAVDVAKRLLDYNFHSPTLAWPVAHALMVEPTESESKEELDRFVASMIQIRWELDQLQQGRWPLHNNPLVHAPHSLHMCVHDHWPFPYSRELAAFPLPSLKHRKCWPTVSRLDDVFGDTHLVVTVPKPSSSHSPPSS
ncbi:glycine decarboxylase subunit P [Coelomomyces lativittatus]|nr:glycine decarboxylase subunit P [Coelomomyces lativittatus]KAJ1518198.1 glycine decarboxylase subunit P [Coelomomyces lativittatus]KAJ1518477.1 glycine decarboxylase subunit P [Coelomomyces lativittatus]